MRLMLRFFLIRREKNQLNCYLTQKFVDDGGAVNSLEDPAQIVVDGANLTLSLVPLCDNR